VTEEAAAGPLTGIAATLADSSASFAQITARHFADDAWPLFYLHLATSVELLGKAALAKTNPVYISGGDFDSLLHLTGNGRRARAPEFVAAVKTIAASESFKRLPQVVDGYRAHGKLIDTLFDRRNGVAHAGTLVRGQEDAILGEVGRYVGPLLDHLGRTAEQHWGTAAALVAEHAERRRDEIEASYQQRVASARLRYEAWVATVGEAALPAILATREPDGPESDFSAFPVECPACGHLGLLHGEAEADWEADWDVADGEAFFAGMYVNGISLSGHGFECSVCRLALDEDELALAGLDSRVFTDDDFDADRAYRHFRDQEDDYVDY